MPAILLSILGLVFLALLVGRVNLSMQFRRQVKTLFDQAVNLSNQTFHSSQLDNLPDPVKRYFNLVLKEGQPYIRFVRMTHDGQFKTGLDKDWINIKGEQYATTEKPGFIWKGTTTMFTARDMYIEDQGRLIVSLFSLVNVVNATGEQYNQGELLRWLGESIMYPTNFLPGERLQWFPIDSNSARLTYNYQGLTLFFNIAFSQAGEIVEMETKRYMDEKRLETWVIKVSDYKEFSNVLVPTVFEVLWRLEKGDFSYAKFHVNKLEYDTARQF